MEEANIVSKKFNSGYMSSIIFLIVVICSTIGLKVYNSSLTTDIEEIKNIIIGIESNIKEVEKDKNLQIYSLLELNKGVIESYKKMNSITKYINHLNKVAIKHNLEFLGFDLSNGGIKTSIKTMSDDKGIAFQKTKRFISDYRLDPNSLFDLGFINSFEGMDIMKFNVEFKIN